MDKINILRLRILIRGAVQGAGFRPFIYHLATSLGLNGWVVNTAWGVLIEVEGAKADLDTFFVRIDREKPRPSFIQSLESSYLDSMGYASFEIRESLGGDKGAFILPDIAICGECLRELLDPANRRYGYPFINCTHCGPRYSIIESLPYDRVNTTMRKFTMCPDCQREYDDPQDRRFHAQPNACPVCGPHLELWDEKGRALARRQEALEGAVAAVRDGRIVAVKGLGGFHLWVSARNADAVARLRSRKHREEKPLALMYPSLEAVRKDCQVSALEERLLLSAESPIVLLWKGATCSVAGDVAPRNPYLGVMLPYAPVHVLLLRMLGSPVVATSANLSEEPMCIDDKQALARLRGIADLFLVHDRPIARQVDDSIVRIMAGREYVLRRARGYAPLPIFLKESAGTILAVGAQLKNTVALSSGHDVFLSQHIGDLENEQSYQVFQRTIADFKGFYELAPAAVACDLHPRYLSSQYAHGLDIPLVGVQHHHAHILSCMAENEVSGRALGISWDGTGYGLDGTMWGGEFLRVDEATCERLAHFLPFPLPGGEKAIREPRRTAIGWMYRSLGVQAFSLRHLPPFRDFSEIDLWNLKLMLQKNISCPVTCSVGRLFDAMAALVDLRQRVRFEGQAAMEMEFSIAGGYDEAYGFSIQKRGGGRPHIVEAPLVREVLNDIEQDVPVGAISAKFHNTLVEVMAALAVEFGQETVVLSGGCFQNRYLTERAISRLQKEGFRVYWHQRVPTNDGGIALGQIAAARHHLRT